MLTGIIVEEGKDISMRRFVLHVVRLMMFHPRLSPLGVRLLSALVLVANTVGAVMSRRNF